MMKFTKMHGIGNDFVVVNGFIYDDIPDPGALSVKMCDRHFGIGADGLIWMVPSDCADARMRIFNSDGSEPEMCGNGLRCAAQFLVDEGIVKSNEMTIETLAGVLTVTIDESGITETSYRETGHYQLTRSFLENPERMLRYLLEE